MMEKKEVPQADYKGKYYCESDLHVSTGKKCAREKCEELIDAFFIRYREQWEWLEKQRMGHEDFRAILDELRKFQEARLRATKPMPEIHEMHRKLEARIATMKRSLYRHQRYFDDDLVKASREYIDLLKKQLDVAYAYYRGDMEYVRYMEDMLEDKLNGGKDEDLWRSLD